MNYSVIEIEDACVIPERKQLDAELPKIEVFGSYNDFFIEHLITNRPCIVSDFISADWKCKLLWVNKNRPNWEYLKDSFGDAEVPVADCKQREYNAQRKETFKLKDYITYVINYIGKGHPETECCLYLKDWHFTRDFPSVDAYQVPKYFASDWLNEYFTARTDVNDDYRFVYMGPKGTWTPLHADVFTSFSWSVNVVGRKRWLFYPPGQELYLKDRLGNLAYDATAPEVFDEVKYPKRSLCNHQFEVIQEAGEAIFVPSGWHHQVWNIEDCISINHNWVNGCNIRQMWFSLRDNLTAVQNEVSDCRDMDDWESHCQLILKASYGLNCKEFFDMLACVAKPRLAQLKGGHCVTVYGGWQLGHKHALWDLHQVLAVLNFLRSDDDIKCLPWTKENQLDVLAQQIEHVLLKQGSSQ